MTDSSIHVERLGKKYRIRHQQPSQRYVALRDVIAASAKRAVSSVANLGHRFTRPDSQTPPSSTPAAEDFWALRDVSFGVGTGEAIGIIGRNGAGKSTLLKILSRITEPTEGRVRIRGHIASLLEVGTGFHPELTGRENIFLNGAVLGMPRTHIKDKFDEIVAFAEVETFLDTPVKHYSSGMYVRLAFAVAAHLEPDILVVDEVLAVGDGEFQKKCLGRMGGVADRGRTVLFVSHQMNQIRRLCRRCLWLQDGRVRMDGPTAEVIGAYETSGATAGPSEENSRYCVQLLSWHLTQADGEPSCLVESDGPVTVRFRIKANIVLRTGHHSIALFREDQMVWGMEVQNFQLDPGVMELVYSLPSLPLAPGPYTWRLVFYDYRGALDVWDCRPPLVIGTMPANYARPEWTGLLNIPCRFSIVHPASELVPH
jgi:lipopolysaccharide transport system ATP-binding protein